LQAALNKERDIKADLLAALKEVLAVMPSVGYMRPESEAWLADKAARAVIAKAESIENQK